MADKRDSLGRRRRQSQNVGRVGAPDKRAAKAGPLRDKSPPKHLSKSGAAWWTWATSALETMGVLDSADVGAINLGAETFDDLTHAMADVKKHGRLVKTMTKSGVMIRRNPAQLTAEKARAFMRALYSDLGLTPAARSKFGTRGDEPEDPFEKLLGMPS
jgi:P27 family predicted phage terminase small subunit